MVSDAKALEWVYAACDEVNRDLPDEEKIAKSEDTVVHGEGSAIDSLTIINFMLAVESVVERESGKRLSLLAGEAFTDSASSTIGRLARHVAERLKTA